MAPQNRELLWWQTGVIYQIYPRSFKDSNDDGIGDLPGITERLDYLAETLGVDAIWISPFYPSPMVDFGYDVADYTAVDPIFGDMAAFDRLVTEAHRRDIRVIIDLVPNHTSDQHPWFQESKASRDNPKRDWYIWSDPRPDGSPPNNWLSIFGGPAWEWDPATGQYYLHSFLKEQPDLNWRNPEVKAAMFAVVRFWLDRGVDGFRIDVAHFIMKDPMLRDNPLTEVPRKAMHKLMGEYDSQVHLFDKDHPDAHTVYRELRQLLESYSSTQPRVAIGEVHIFDWKKWAAYYGKNLDEIHLPFNFQLLNIPWTAEAVRQIVDTQEASIPPGAWPNYVLGNHDEPRLATRLGLPGARLAAMLLLTLRGTPTLYYGDEIGMTDGQIPPDLQQDPLSARVPGLGRDPCRTPMQWTPGKNAGFSSSNTSRLWLPVTNNYSVVNVERQLTDPGSILNLYRQLLAYRKKSQALQAGQYLPVDKVPSGCFAYLRRMEGGDGVFIMLNFNAHQVEVQIPEFKKGCLKLSTHMDRAEEIDFSEWVLRGNEGVIIDLR